MKNFYISTSLILFAFSFFKPSNMHSQELMLKMPFKEQVSKSTHIIEGKVIDKKTFWNDRKDFIYTVSTIEVYKVFKGKKEKQIKIITPGGFKDGQGLKISPSLDLHINEIGIFLLNRTSKNLQGTTFNALYKPTGRIQAFYRYDILTDRYANTFNHGIGIEKKLYEDIKKTTNRDYARIKDFDVGSERRKMQRSSAPQDITSISPLTTSGGTSDVLTITGTNFGNDIGTVLFPNPDNAGETYLEAYDSHIVSWTDTEILIKVPSFAGTGPVRVRNTDNDLFISDRLTVSYTHLNVEIDDESVPREDRTEFKTQLYNKNGQGGYTWFYSFNFNSNEQAKSDFERAFFNWVCATGVNWSLGGVTGRNPQVDQGIADGFNVVGFRDDVDDDPTDGTTIAAAISRFDGCDDGSGGIDVYVIDTDIVYNSDIDFNYGPQAPQPNEIDFETVTLHELGHGHQLGHIIDPGALMHFAVNGGSVVRDFEPNDILGGEAVFNRSANEQICSRPLMTQSSCSLSTEELNAMSLSVFPNPASNTINVRAQSSIKLLSINVIDIQGRIVNQRAIENDLNEFSIDVSKFSNGVYFLKIDSNQGEITKKIVIQ